MAKAEKNRHGSPCIAHAHVLHDTNKAPLSSAQDAPCTPMESVGEPSRGARSEVGGAYAELETQQHAVADVQDHSDHGAEQTKYPGGSEALCLHTP